MVSRLSARFRSRRGTGAVLARLGVPRSRLSAWDTLREAATTVNRSSARSVLTSMGTVLAVATAIATIGLADSASGAVSGTFNALRATLVTFTDGNPAAGGQVLTEASERAMDRLNGVRSAGLIWTMNGGQAFDVSRIAGQPGAGLTLTAATPAALATIGARVTEGRAYDAGMEHRGDKVALLGATAARELGITSVDLSPVIYVDGTPLTVIGIVGSTAYDGETLLGVFVPPGVATAVDVPDDSTARSLFVRTAPGAAQVIASQGPSALDPLDPSRVIAEAPPDPNLLHNQVSASLTTLLLAVAIVVLIVGIIAIGNTVLLSVIQRRPEIGLRRSVGAAPRHVAAMIVTEAALIGAVGGIIGDSFGIVITAAVAASKGWTPVLDQRIALAAPLAGVLAGLIAGAYPAWRASRITPISALQR